jgi:chaperone BCS1
MLLTWVSSEPFAHRASSFLASVGATRKGFANRYSDGSQKKPLHYSPWNGSFSFWYKNRLLTFRSVQNENRFFPKEEISVSCIGRSTKILKDLFSECRTEYLKLVEKKTSVFKHPDGNWQKTKTNPVVSVGT